jgi:hypothetical protein
MKTRKNYLVFILLFCLLQFKGFAQQFELGLGAVVSNPDGIGYNIHSLGGYQTGKKLMIGLSCDYDIWPVKKTFYDSYIDKGRGNKILIHPDTSYNVVQKFNYSIFCLSIDPKIYSSSGKSKIYTCPNLGFGVFREQQSITSSTRSIRDNTYRVFKPSLGLEMGIEHPLGKKSPLSLQMAFSTKVFISFFKSTDIYSTSFLHSTSLNLRGRLALVWRLRKK